MTVVSKDDVDKTLGFLYNRHTVTNYRSTLLPFVGTELTAPSVQKVVAGWAGYSRSTINTKKAALKRLVAYKASIGECDPAVLDTVMFPDGKPPTKRRPLKPEEFDRFIEAAAGTVEDSLLAVVLFDTGLRPGFIPNIRYGDLKSESFKMQVKNNSEVEVFPTVEMGRLAELLRRALGASDDNYIFTADDEPTSYKFVLRSFNRIAARAGIEGVTPHSARHTFAQRLNAAGATLPEIATLMAHRNVQTTMGYIHPNKETMKSRVQNIAVTRRHE